MAETMMQTSIDSFVLFFSIISIPIADWVQSVVPYVAGVRASKG
jgi:hypothetical protein